MGNLKFELPSFSEIRHFGEVKFATLNAHLSLYEIPHQPDFLFFHGAEEKTASNFFRTPFQM